MNPVDEPLPLGTAFAFFDQLTTNYSLISGNITMTIILPSTIDLTSVGFLFYAYNMSGTEQWDLDQDALKLLSNKQEVPQIFSLINGEIKASINSLPEQVDNYEIPLITQVDTNRVYELCFRISPSLI